MDRFLMNLYHRGLEGKILKMAVTDGNKGLKNALDLVYPMTKPQRCWAHKLRNVSKKLTKKIEKECINEARKIYSAENKNEAMRYYREWTKDWKEEAPEAVNCLSEDIGELLTFYENSPKKMWVKLRTTNIIERTFREVRRRTRPISCFQNKESVERIVFSVFNRLNGKWFKDKPLFTPEEITQYI